MPFKEFKFLLQNKSNGDIEEMIVEAHTFPEAASQAYVECNNLRKGSDTWTIVSAVDQQFGNKE
tara:strand:- start:1874 stop:2065 length:192 start_codon:yes stop_codon:yes gene_type:complete